MKKLSLKELLAKATPGPWKADGTDICAIDDVMIADCWFRDGDISDADAALLAHAANHIGPLVEALEAVLSSARPHPEENPSMFQAFKHARAVLVDAKSVEVSS